MALNLHHLPANDLEIKFQRVIGKFDNVIFVESERPVANNRTISSAAEPKLFDEVTILDLTKSYPRLRKAHVVGKKTYSYILDTDNCKPGSLVLHNN